jgi:hypothetical protein
MAMGLGKGYRLGPNSGIPWLCWFIIIFSMQVVELHGISRISASLKSQRAGMMIFPPNKQRQSDSQPSTFRRPAPVPCYSDPKAERHQHGSTALEARTPKASFSRGTATDRDSHRMKQHLVGTASHGKKTIRNSSSSNGRTNGENLHVC